MRLVASVICRNELGRYLEPFIAHLQEFVDEIAVLDDCSTDGTYEWLIEQPKVRAMPWPEPAFFEHEGRARQSLLEFTLALKPSHVLAIDADEGVSDGAILRAACEADEGPGAWAVGISEVWKADAGRMWLRVDGAWGAQGRSPLLYRVPKKLTKEWRIADRALACGREPMAVRKLQAVSVDATVYHFGWTREEERAARYQRYVEHDGGRFHNSKHLDSIMWDDRRVRLKPQPWPPALERWKEAILGS